MSSLLHRIDHLVYAAPDLAAGVDHLERLLSVRALPGGRHPQWGTHNAIVPLGATSYLEIIAPDPERPDPGVPRHFGLDRIATPRLTTWAANGRDLEEIVEQAKTHGVDLGAVRAGSRLRPDGVLLEWQLTDPAMPRADGILPFFIDWGTTPHPGSAAPARIRLLALRAEHPNATEIGAMLEGLELDLTVDDGPAPALVATLETPRGTVELR